MLTTRDSPAVVDTKARYWSKIAIFAPFRGFRRNIAITFGMEIIEWYSYPVVKKNCRYVYSFRQNART